jgi:hypothetical protein
MAGEYVYGSQDPVYFKLTLNGVGVAAKTLLDADVTLQKDGVSGGNIGLDCLETAAGNGWYAWTPDPATDTQCKTIIINIKDSAGSTFDENAVTLNTGGHASAFFSG